MVARGTLSVPGEGGRAIHIPDGYLGPQTYLAAYGLMVPLWSVASSRVRGVLRGRRAPLMALGAAFTFVIMMFNVPVPGGTAGHAVGAALVAILLGPWSAVVAVSLALAVQALLFGDGGITALAANCLNMAVVMPFAGFWTFRILAGSAPATSRRAALSAAAGGYVGLNAAALAASVEFGIQPLVATDAAGRALYCPFGLEIAVPAMVLEHLLLFGFVEAVVTGAAFAYLAKAEPRLLPQPGAPGGAIAPAPSLRSGKLWLLLAALVLLSPLGLYLPARFGAGSAWGEWSSGEIERLAGYVPAGLGHLETLWRAPLPDYAPGAGGEASLFGLSLWYLASGFLGAAAVGLAAFAIRRWATRGETRERPS